MGSHLCATAFALGLSLLAFVPTAGADTVTLHPPDGFETTAESELTLVDVYLFDRFIAETPVRFEPDAINFTDAAGLVSVLPDLNAPGRVERALEAALDPNAHLACSSVLASGACGFVHADVIAVIFDVARFRVDLFIHPRFTYERDPRFKYLPPPTKSPGLLTRLNSRSIYDFDRRVLAGTHNLRTVAGYGRWAGRAELVTDFKDTHKRSSSPGGGASMPSSAQKTGSATFWSGAGRIRESGGKFESRWRRRFTWKLTLMLSGAPTSGCRSMWSWWRSGSGLDTPSILSRYLENNLT